MTKHSIVTFTMNPAVDLFGETDEIFDDSKSRCRQIAVEPGGGGINVARNIQRLGSSTLAIFPAGGPNGRYLETLLERAGQPFESIKIAAHTRQNFAITDRKRGAMQHFVFPAPDLTEVELKACRDLLIQKAKGYLVLSGSLPDSVSSDFYAQVIREVSAKGVKVALDTSGCALKNSLSSGVYLAKLNRKEFASLGYEEHAPIVELREQMRALVKGGAAQVLIVTLNRGGALLVSNDGSEYYVQAPKVQIISHVGAGDAFMSALIQGLDAGRPLREAFRSSVAAAYITVQREGNQLDDLNWLKRAYDEVTEVEL